jgi:uncharacterized protein
MRVWIDHSNSPHPLLFEPIVRELEARGHEVLMTARDNAQTVELARERWPRVAVVGGPSPGGRVRKGAAVAGRVRALRSWACESRPDVALSHNSFAQLAAARLVGIPAVNAMDYEHQPANHISFRLASRLLLPQALKDIPLSRYGVRPSRTSYYGGLKEELYLGEFMPDFGIAQRLGVERRDGDALVVARTPPSGALYHRAENPLFIETLRRLNRQDRVNCVVLTRRPAQREALRALALPRLMLPERAVDSRSLMYAADLVVGAGGTMTREAAILGVPTISVFAGPVPAVDRWLERRGMLRRLERPEQLVAVKPRPGPPTALRFLRQRSEELVEEFVDAVLAVDGVRALGLATAPAHG